MNPVLKLNYSLTNYSWINSLAWGNCLGHYKQAFSQGGTASYVHTVIALVESLPIVGQIASCLETAIVKKVKRVNQTRAALMVQTNVRTFLAKRELKRIKSDKAAATIQTACHHFLARKKLESTAASTIQSAINEYLYDRYETRVKPTVDKIGFQVFAYLSKQDRDNLTLTSKQWRNQKFRWLVQPYAGIREGFITLTVSGATGSESVKIVSGLGRGGSKRAYRLDNNLALLLPNADMDPLREVKQRWPEVVKGEVKMSQFLTEVGLLSPRSEEVSITFKYNVQEHTVPAYTSLPFQMLKEQEHIYVVDCKNPESSTWKPGDVQIFTSLEDRYDLENWDAVINPFIEDVKILQKYKLPMGGDSVNLALQKTVSGYALRYFGFDFTSKYGGTYVPRVIQDEGQVKKPIVWSEDARFLLEFALSCLIDREFHSCLANEATRQGVKNFEERLSARFLV